MSMSKATSLSKIVMPPSKLASFLSWRKNNGILLALQLSGDSVDIAVAHKIEHEASQVCSIDCKSMFHGTADEYLKTPTVAISGDREWTDEQRSAMKVRRGKLEEEFAHKIADVVGKYDISAVVANWPVDPDGRRLPKECGKVLRVLDIINTHTPGVLSTNRPVALLEENRSYFRISVGTQAFQKFPTNLSIDFMNTFWEHPSEESQEFLFVSDTLNRPSFTS